MPLLAVGVCGAVGSCDGVLLGFMRVSFGILHAGVVKLRVRLTRIESFRVYARVLQLFLSPGSPAQFLEA